MFTAAGVVFLSCFCKSSYLFAVSNIELHSICVSGTTLYSSLQESVTGLCKICVVHMLLEMAVTMRMSVLSSGSWSHWQMTPSWTALTDLVSREIDKVVEKSGILMMVGKKIS